MLGVPVPDPASGRPAATSGPPAWTVRVLPECGSTNAELARDAQPWSVVVTDHQTSGRGRLARVWETPAHAALTLSAALPVPPGREPDLGWLPLLTGLAVRSAVAAHGVDVVLKWPNDVLVTAGEGKLCGILCELATCGPGEHAGERVVVVGIGLNVDQARAELPVPQATSMTLAGAPAVDRERLLVDLLGELGRRHAAWAAGGTAFAELREEYLRTCVTIGREVTIMLAADRSRAGVATAVDADGRLVVAGADGVVAHAAGDVVHARLAGRA